MESKINLVMETFTNKYLKGKGSMEDEQLLGFVVLDSELGVIAASTYDPNYVAGESNPVKNWIIYKVRSSIRAFVLSGKDDFQNFLKANHSQLEAIQ